MGETAWRARISSQVKLRFQFFSNWDLKNSILQHTKLNFQRKVEWNRVLSILLQVLWCFEVMSKLEFLAKSGNVEFYSIFPNVRLKIGKILVLLIFSRKKSNQVDFLVWVLFSGRRPKWTWLVEFSELNAVFCNQEQTFIGTQINQELIKSKVI